MSNNTKLPAYPVDPMEWDNVNAKIRKDGPMAPWSGFTKLELASLMIAQGFAARVGVANSPGEHEYIATVCTEMARAVLLEANK
jgi:hypothetical protein